MLQGNDADRAATVDVERAKNDFNYFCELVSADKPPSTWAKEIGYMALSLDSLEAAARLFSTYRHRASYVPVHPELYYELERRYEWQSANETHDIWDGYDWNHGMADQVRARGLFRRRKMRAIRRSRAANARRFA